MPDSSYLFILARHDVRHTQVSQNDRAHVEDLGDLKKNKNRKQNKPGLLSTLRSWGSIKHVQMTSMWTRQASNTTLNVPCSQMVHMLAHVLPKAFFCRDTPECYTAPASERKQTDTNSIQILHQLYGHSLIPVRYLHECKFFVKYNCWVCCIWVYEGESNENRRRATWIKIDSD